MRTAIVAAGGIGDQLLAIQCASFVPMGATVYSCSRDEVFKILDHFFWNVIELVQVDHKLGENNLFLDVFKNEEKHSDVNHIRQYGEVFYVTPDGMFCNPMAFDFVEHNANPKAIVTRRLLLDRWEPRKRVFLGLSSVEAYKRYEPVGALLNAIAVALPDYEIVVPLVRTWGDSDTGAPELENLPNNVKVSYDLPAKEVCSLLETSCYGIFIDNGFSHLAYHLGMPRLVLDAAVHNLPFVARWREDASESIPLKTPFNVVADIVKLNVTCPQSNLVARSYFLNGIGDIRQTLIMKWEQQISF